MAKKIPSTVVPVIGGKTYPKERVISVTPEQEKRIEILLGHKGRVGKHGIKHYPPASNSDAGVAETKASGGQSPGNTGNTTDSKDKGTNNASRESQGNVQGTPSRGGQPNNTESRSPGNVNSQPATQKMAGSTQKGLVDPSRISKTSITRDDGMRAPVGENAPNKTYPTAADNKEIQDLRDHLNRQQTDINALLDTIRGPNLVETNLIKQPYGPVKQGTINPELQARMDALIKANQPIVANPSYFGDLPKAPIQNKTYPTVETYLYTKK